MQGGNIVNLNGTGHQSIYGSKFKDEGVRIKHSHAGLVSMINSGSNTFGSQFLISFTACPHFDGIHTVIGRVIHGFDTCKQI